MVGRALVVGAIHQPAILDAHRILEPQQGIDCGHQSTGEEMPAHPVVLAGGFERVQQCAVTKDMDEELALRTQPAADAVKQGGVVAHVLEHLHRNATIEASGGQFEPVDIAGHDAHVGMATFAAARLDELALRRRIGDRRDARMRIAFGHEQGQ